MRINHTHILAAVILFSIVSCNSTSTPASSENKWIMPGDDDHRTIQTALINVKPGDTLFFGEGIFRLTNSLSLSGIDSVTIKGKGMDSTIFSFKEQTAGAEGLLVTANHFAIEDIAIEDTKGDGIKIKDADGVVIRGLRMEWTNGADSSNGSYGIYPVSSKNILMEDCVAKGASDAGIYVGQSVNAIMRRNRAEGNVAGIEIENSDNVEAYENVVTNNTAGLLVFDLPDLPKKNGKNVKVYNNEIMDNNHPNFSPLGISVSIVPAGVGMLLMACQHVEAYNNRIVNNKSLGITIVNLNMSDRKTTDSLFDKYPSAIYLHDNYFERAAVTPDTSRDLGKMFYSNFADNPPMIFYDGVPNPALLAGNKLPDELRICIRNNENATFFNMAAKSASLQEYDCEHPTFPALNF